jgi:hypothetical protein
MSSGLGYPSLQNPITKSGRVVVNGKKDRVNVRRRQTGKSKPDDDKILQKGGFATPTVSYYRDNSDENFSVLNHEIGLHVSKGSTAYHVTAPHEGSVSTITSCNNWPASDIGLPAYEDVNGFSRYNHIKKTCFLHYLPYKNADITAVFNPMECIVSFAGVASTRALHDSRDMARNEDDCVLQTGGMCTMFNGGIDTIEVNQYIMWDFPDTPKIREKPKPEGVPSTKGQFIPVVYAKVVRGLERAFLDSKTNVNSLFAAIEFQHYLQHINGRVIGRSLTRAPPGTAFDILLGSFIC